MWLLLPIPKYSMQNVNLQMWYCKLTLKYNVFLSISLTGNVRKHNPSIKLFEQDLMPIGGTTLLPG